MSKSDLTTKPAIAIYAITLLVSLALLKGIDGVLLASAFSLIAGLGGYAIGTRKGKG